MCTSDRAGSPHKSLGRTGHVAVVTESTPKFVRIIEQNWEDRVWDAGTNYSREIPAEVAADGAYSIKQKYILGWMRVGEPVL